MFKHLKYALHSGKPNKPLYFLREFSKMAVPDALYRSRLSARLARIKSRPDYPELLQRVDYYIRLHSPFSLPEADKYERGDTWVHYIGTTSGYRRNMCCSAYYFDQHNITRHFPAHLRWSYCPGDVYFTPEVPTIVKSRLLSDDNHCSVLLKLDSLRHFMFVSDKKPFRDKADKVIFRGKIRNSRLRTAFMERFCHHPIADCGIVGHNEGYPCDWMAEKKTIREHLDYKFIMALEGNDVASNLKWVMSSNSLAVMTRPTCETWFMEGRLQAGLHYVEVKEDFSDLEEKLHYYIAHPNEAEAIIANAHDYIQPFLDAEREEDIALLVLERYMKLSGQI